MPRYTHYTKPSISKQIENGAGTLDEIKELYGKLQRDGASSKTLKRIRKALQKSAAIREARVV